MSRPRQHRRAGAWLIPVLALLGAIVATPATALIPSGAAFAPAAVAAASPGLTMTADTRYTVDPARHRVRVAVGLTAKNHRSDTKTHRYFFDRVSLAVQPGTTNFKVASAGTHPAVRVQRRTATYTLLRIDFGRRLAAGQSRRLDLAFDIVDKGGAPTRTTRIGSTLVSFGAWGFATSGTAGGTVSVAFPAGFAVDVNEPLLGKPTTDPTGRIVYTTAQLAHPLTFFAYFVADRPGSYAETTFRVDVGDESVPVTIRAWPDDPAWAKRVTSLLKRGLPALAKDIGLHWPLDQPLIVSEALSRNTTGFAGRYNPPSGEVEIAYYANTFVVLHEAAHAWFDGRLLADRWATEGFASFYALRAAKAIGEKNVKADTLTPKLAAVRVPLNAWGAPGQDPPAVEDAEYAAALQLASEIGKKAGTTGLSAVWQAIHESRAAYQPVGTGASLETATGAPDWRGLLDLLEERTGASFSDLWSTWVVRPAEASLLDARESARTRYRTTSARAGSWLLPRVVRDALRSWQFDQVNDLLDGASRALDDRDTVAAAAAGAGLTPPETMATDFEGPRGFAATAAEADAELAAISAYRQAVATRPVDPSLLTTIGLWNSDPHTALGQAADAFSAGDLQASVASSAYAARIWTTAGEVGRNRVVAVGASLAAFLLAVWLVYRSIRDRGSRRRRRRYLAAHKI